MLVRITSASNYWSASEYNGNNAWYANFGNGNFNNNNKYNSLTVRAVAALTDEEILSIIEAFNDCCRHKKTAMQCTLFRLVYEYELLLLYAEMKLGLYHPSTSVVFIVTRPRLREVYAANFRDRIVQHWIVIRVEPLIERRFLETGDASYNCRKGYGTLRAVQRLQSDMRDMSMLPTENLSVMRLDIQSFFMSIDVTMLDRNVFDLIDSQYLGDDKAMLIRLCHIVITHRPDKDCIYRGDPHLRDLMPKNKTMENMPDGRAMPIGNITSQEFANFFMTSFDLLALLYCKKFGCRYCRFVDDFYMIGSKEALLRFRALAEEFLREELHLTLHPDKVYIQPIAHGITFVGTIINVHRTRLIGRTMSSLYESVMELERQSRIRYETGSRTTAHEQHLLASINSLLGFTSHTNDFGRKLKLFASAAYLHRYYRISGTISKIQPINTNHHDTNQQHSGRAHRL